MKKGSFYKKLLGLILALTLVLTPLIDAKAGDFKSGDNLGGLGKVTSSFSREIYPGLIWSQIRSNNRWGRQFSQLFEYNFNSMNLAPKVTVGKYVYGNETVRSMVNRYEKAGYTVVFAVNGDSFKDNGNPKGMVITDGSLITTPETSTLTLGFIKGKGWVYGYPGVDIYVKTSEGTAPIKQLNKERKGDENGNYLLTGDFLNRSRSSKEGVEVLVDVTSSSYRGLKIGGEFTGKVNDVYQVGNKSSGNNTPLGKNQWIISCHKNSRDYAMLSSLKKGSPITVTITSNARDVDWSSVDQAIGVFRPLKMSGVNTSRVKQTGIHPRTSLLYSADGRVLVMENDGRRSSARGLSFEDKVKVGDKFGLENVMGFDGGGSSTVFITMPGYTNAVKVNQPSDRWDRAVGNALLFVKPRKNGTSLTRLHVYPEKGYSDEIVVGTGQSVKPVVKGTDDNFDPVSINTGKLTFSSSLGKQQGDRFVAGGQTGKGILEVKYPGGAKGQIKLRVVNSVKSLEYGPGSLMVQPGGEVQLEILGKTDSKSIKLDSNSLTYELSSPELGNVDENGLFKAGDKEAKGSLKVSFGDRSLDIPVIIKAKKNIERLAGESRFETAKKIADKMTTRGTALLASSENYPDALVSGLLANKKQAPILLTGGNKLNRETLKALSEKNIKKVVILGGNSAVPNSIEKELKKLGYETERIGGNDRYETAVKISQMVGSSDTFYLASGVNYPDALSVSALSINENRPLLLTDRDKLSKATKESLVNAGAKQVIIVGGPAAVSSKVENELKAMGIKTSRIAGKTRYETSALIAGKLVNKGAGLLLTRGDNFIDSVTAGPLAGALNRAILLLSRKDIPAPCRKLIETVKAEDCTIIGGNNAISKAVEDMVGVLVK